MGRQKKKEELSLGDKKYITLSLKTHNNINYDELFKRLSVELDKSEQLIRDYADKVKVDIIDEQLPPEPKPKILKPEQKMVRDLLTPNRHTESNKARHITVMSDAASETLDKSSSGPIKGSSKTRDCIFRQ